MKQYFLLFPSASPLALTGAKGLVCRCVRPAALMVWMILLAFIAGCAGKNAPASSDESVATNGNRAAANRELSFLFSSGLGASQTDMLARLAKADYILIGEQHTSAEHHRAQAHIIRMLAQAGLSPAIGLEMVPATLQPQLDVFNRRGAGLNELPRLINWEKTWGFDYGLYEPVFAVAENYNIPVYGLNVSSAAVKEIRRHNGISGLSADMRQEIPPAVMLPGPVQREKLTSFFQQHATMLMGRKKEKSATETRRPSPEHGKTAQRRFLLIQSVWDTTMACNAMAVPRKGPLVILAGGGHVEYGHGIAYRIRNHQPGADIVLIMPVHKGRTRFNSGEADFYFK